MLQGVLNVRLVAALSLFGLFLLVGCSSGERPEASPQMWATQPVMCSIGSGRVVLFTEDFDVVEGGTIRHGNERYCDYPLGGDMQVLWRYSPDWPFATYTVDGIEVQRLPDRATFTCPRVPGGSRSATVSLMSIFLLMARSWPRYQRRRRSTRLMDAASRRSGGSIAARWR